MGNTYYETGENLSLGEVGWGSIPSNYDKVVTAEGKTVYRPGTGSGSGSGSSGGSSSSKSKASGFDIEKEARRLKKEAEEKKKAEEKARKERIGKNFDPIFEELDRQLSSLPTRQKQYEEQIGSMAGEQAAAAERSKESSLASLETSKGQVTEQAQSSLRDLEGDIRNEMKAKVNMLGAASRSSAADQVSEAVMREGLKGRSKILSTRDAAYADIETKRADINNLASEQNAKIDSWKNQSLFQIGQDFSDKVDALSKEKANASAERAQAIDNMITGLENEFYGTLQQLDQQVLNYKSTISTWQMQREAELEDYATKLGMSAKYTKLSDDAKAYEQANQVFKESISMGMNAQEAQLRAFNQTGVDPLKGLSLTQDMIDKIKREAGNTAYITQDAMGNPVYIDKNNPGGGYNAIPNAGGEVSSGNAGGNNSGLFGSILNLISGQ